MLRWFDPCQDVKPSSRVLGRNVSNFNGLTHTQCVHRKRCLCTNHAVGQCPTRTSGKFLWAGQGRGLTRTMRWFQDRDTDTRANRRSVTKPWISRVVTLYRQFPCFGAATQQRQRGVCFTPGVLLCAPGTSFATQRPLTRTCEEACVTRPE